MLIEWLRRRQEVVIPYGLLLASFLLLAFQSYRTMKVSWFCRAIISVGGAGQKVVTGSQRGLADFWKNYIWLRGVEEENQRLREENQLLRRQLSFLEEQRRENVRLRALANFKPRGEIKKWIPAEVIGHSLSGLTRTLTIDKGSWDGIRPRMAVITYESILVGQILDQPGSAIGYSTSQVLLITDHRSQVPVEVQRSRVALGSLTGQPEFNDCLLRFLFPLQRSDAVQVGDILITSGLGGVFKKGWPVGRVSAIISDPSQRTPSLTVKPLADFYTLEEVLVIDTE